MNKYQKHALKKMMENDGVFTHGPSYDENFKQTSTGDPSDLMDDPRYKLGFERCSARWKRMLNFLMNATTADCIKYAGKPK